MHKDPYEIQLIRVHDELIIHLPQSLSQTFSSRATVMADAVINGMSFHTPLEPDGLGSHWFFVPDDILHKAKLLPGDNVELDITESKRWTEPPISADVLRVLQSDPLILAAWNGITVKARWEWFRWISATQNEATRVNRISVMLDKLRRGDKRPCCFNRNICTVQSVSRNGRLDLRSSEPQ